MRRHRRRTIELTHRLQDSHQILLPLLALPPEDQPVRPHDQAPAESPLELLDVEQTVRIDADHNVAAVGGERPQAELLAPQLDPKRIDEIGELGRWWTIPVSQGAEHRLEGGLVLGGRQLPICAQAQPLVTDVRTRQEVVERQVDVDLRRREHVPDLLLLTAGAQARHGRLQHLQVHLETHGRYRAVLLHAEEVTGATYLQVSECDLEALP